MPLADQFRVSAKITAPTQRSVVEAMAVVMLTWSHPEPQRTTILATILGSSTTRNTFANARSLGPLP